MTSLQRFSKACRCENVDRPPVWLMRQAGRYLPEYRALREKHDFLKLLTNDELICEISLEPWQRFHMDAVIVFSDILLLPMVMGMDLQFLEGQGPKFSKLISSEKDIENLKSLDPEKDIPFLITALRQLKKELKEETVLIGFAGSPWTVASYMMRQVTEKLRHRLLERLTHETITYLKAQIKAGVDCIQIFDSWGGSLTLDDYAIWSAPYIKDIIDALRPTNVPIILYVKESEKLLDQMIETGCQVISVGWETSLAEVKKKANGKIAIQGNFNPHILMQASPNEIRTQVKNMLKTMEGYDGYIANLGHGVLPKTPVENVQAFVETVKETK